MSSKSRRSSTKRNLPLVAHLGNIGYGFLPSPLLTRTARRALNFPSAHFLGIDIRKPVSSKRLQLALQALPPEKREKLFPLFNERRKLLRRNLSQRQAHFAKGLERLKDNSTDRIESVLGVGHYLESGKDVTPRTAETSRAYTQKIIGLSFRKLKPGGKLVLVVGNQVFSIVLDAIQRLPFEKKSARALPETAAWTESLAGLNDPDQETKLVEYFPIRVVVARKPQK